MAKEVAIGKRLKISQAQQHMLLAVFGAAIVFGACLAATLYFVKLISFNAEVIAAKEAAIRAYSDTIKNVGVCTKPRGDTYSDDELKACNPNTTSLSAVSGTLRSNILQGVASNVNLSMVSKESGTNCLNTQTGRNWTYDELQEKYNNAETDAEADVASALMKTCSALRVIPDALPAIKNESALLSSLNQVFIISGWEPESLSPSINTDDGTEDIRPIDVSLSVEADAETTIRVLNNIERSIREFNINTATIEWDNDGLNLKARATAFYVDKTELIETTNVIKAVKDGKKK